MPLYNAGSVPSNLTVSGYTTLQGAQTNSDFASFGNISVAAAGSGFKVKEGANATLGTATLAAGTVVVSTTAVKAASRIFLTTQSVGGTAGALSVSARTPGASFTVTSTSGADTSTFAWILVEAI